MRQQLGRVSAVAAALAAMLMVDSNHRVLAAVTDVQATVQSVEGPWDELWDGLQGRYESWVEDDIRDDFELEDCNMMYVLLANHSMPLFEVLAGNITRAVEEAAETDDIEFDVDLSPFPNLSNDYNSLISLMQRAAMEVSDRTSMAVNKMLATALNLTSSVDEASIIQQLSGVLAGNNTEAMQSVDDCRAAFGMLWNATGFLVDMMQDNMGDHMEDHMVHVETSVMELLPIYAAWEAFSGFAASGLNLGGMANLVADLSQGSVGNLQDVVGGLVDGTGGALAGIIGSTTTAADTLTNVVSDAISSGQGVLDSVGELVNSISNAVGGR